ncbi:MAG: amino acid ABC transporter substrate-binding protein [Acidimicrobiia bacterium]|nr:amino acid ABC transporter substrate-binding protein [Acidimicrobiia bacterium]
MGGGSSEQCTVRIGAALSETGNFAREGQWNQRGYDIWLNWVNDEYGGIKVGDQTCNAEIVYYDDESDPDTSARLYEKLISEDEVDFLLGPYSSGITMGTSAIAEKNGVIMVEAHGASEALFERGFENLFAVLTPASYYTESALQALAESGAKTMVIANRDEAFSTAAADGAEQWAADYGLEVLARETYPPDADLSAIMTKFRDLDPDVFVGAGHFNDSIAFVRSAQELGFAPDAMMLTVGPDSPEFAAELGADANFILGDSQWDRTMPYKDEYFGTADDYANRYQEAYGELPPYQAASSTAAALALHLAIEQAGSLETDAVRDALNNLDVDTFYGRINFDETGKNTAKPMVTVQVQDGEALVTAPTDLAGADLVYPMPPWSDR